MTILDPTFDTPLPAAAGPGPATRTGIWGLPGDRVPALRATVGAAVVVAAYWAAARAWAPQLTPTRLEVLGTVTSLACVWLTRRQNIWSMPIGIVSVIAMGAFFFDIGLVGQGWLHLGFYIPIQFVAWRLWLRDGPDGTEAPVRRLGPAARAGTVVAAAAVTVAAVAAFSALHGPAPYAWWDASIVAASVVAQLLLTGKRVESWLYWVGPVDVSAVGLYVATGAHLFAALYLLYVVVAATGFVHWRRALSATDAGVDAVTARRGTGTILTLP